ncbi:phosphoethanolamine transferase [Zhongshania aliphaticivorans]|uniref:phosphoethanolamine transferase n=1 Tax=Zhongshania aliphaticivorans TaxID=1470434 RepID=UPI0012E5B124|nr:phosphoethanolamine--lipid A transferase [Zhongshania aliphaticivorans]CAA0119655.1 putative phosphatidylethanolamine transferase Mcr-1 [Zhongshania aliphaticivorans]
MNTASNDTPPKTFLSAYSILIVLSLFLCVTANLTFFKHVLEIYPWATNQAFIFSLAVLVFACLLFLAAIFSLVVPVRVTAAIFLMVAASSAYFSDTFGTVIDTEMLRNVLETNAAESADLLNMPLLARLLLLGLVPSLLVWRHCERNAGFVRSAVRNGLTAVIALGIAAASIASFSSQYASFFREHKQVRYYISPAYPIYSAFNFAASFMPSGPTLPFQVLQAQANIFEEQEAHSELIILVVGETARADHFSLNGYERETNPELSRLDHLISYSDIQSCGTATAISVPCMFSYSRHDNFDLKSARNTENGLDLLQSAGVNVLWRDNNSNSKGVADRVEFESFRSPARNPICDSECRDIGMLEGLQEYVDGHSGDTLIVLHQMGSHGPAYFERYPKEFEQFTPACQSAELSECTQQEVINAYDNTILYTDYFLSQVIRFLQANSGHYETSMFYVSDHGESLGESGIYLHGMPYGFAPKAQTHVPVLAWVGESSDIDYEQSKLLKDIPNTHDAVFDTLMTVFEVTTDLLPTSDAKLVTLEPEEDAADVAR